MYLYTQTDRTPREEAVEGEDPEIVSLLVKAESKAKAKVRRCMYVCMCVITLMMIWCITEFF